MEVFNHNKQERLRKIKKLIDIVGVALLIISGLPFLVCVVLGIVWDMDVNGVVFKLSGTVLIFTILFYGLYTTFSE